MKQIKLNKSVSNHLFAIVDDDMFDELSKHNWSFGIGGYAYRKGRTADKKQFTILMHRQIMNPPRGKVVDHINHVGTDNRRENLRICLHKENIANQLPQNRIMVSRFKGVHLDKRDGVYQAEIKKNGKRTYLGRYKKETDAALAYNNAAVKLFGEFALLNKIESEEE